MGKEDRASAGPRRYDAVPLAYPERRTSLGHSQVAIRRRSGLWILSTEPSQRSQGLASRRGAFADPG